MKARIRAVRLRVHTNSGAAGARIVFRPGMNVIRGENSKGKTQALQAIIYSLGLEGMFGPGQSSRLGSAMTQQLLLPARIEGGNETTEEVNTSWCAVEMENSLGEILTALRPVRHPTLGSNLVKVWRAPVITDPSTQGRADEYFVREGGAVQRERGFHGLLATFLGWSLPLVPRYTGGEVPLYPEIIAPFFYGDQRAWGSAGARQVTHFQIREPTRRAVEFLLAFVGPAAQAERHALEERIVSLRAEWAAGRQGAAAGSAVAGARLVGVPEYPAGARAGSRGEVSATDLSEAGLEVFEGGNWQPISDAVVAFRDRVRVPVATSDDGAQSVADVGVEELRERLAQTEGELADLLATAGAVEQRLLLNEGQLVALDRRINALEDERDRNQDVRTLLRLGGDHPQDHLSDGDCPTCHQSLASVEVGGLGSSLSVDETLGLLNAQLATMRGMREQAHTAVEQGRSAYAAVQRAADAARSQVRALRADLVAPADYPSVGDITQRVVAETRLSELDRLNSAVRGTLDRLQQVAVDIAEARTALNRLPSTLPTEDVHRRETLTRVMREQLEAFGFSSYDSRKLSVNEETLRPERAGFDIDTDISASDVVRTKIAYLNAVRELADQVGGRHPGLLMLDEPRQHELDEEHFRSTLSRLASGSEVGNQVIVTSAASVDALSELLSENQATIVDLGGLRLIQREPLEDQLDPRGP